jgi:8-oxo-dGTP diphosphatase
MKVDQIIEVAAGILTDAQGRVLLMQRLPGKHLAGLWEFPGGKVEPRETIAQALVRELEEELGIEVLGSAPLISIPWHYPEKSVRLHALRVTAWKGEPRAREGHPLRWLAPCDMDAAEMPAADAPILAALRLPPYYVISTVDGGRLETGLAEVAGGEGNRLTPTLSPPGRRRQARGAWRVREDAATNVLWQLRMPGASREELRHMVERAITAGPRARASLLVNHDIELARELRVGVHLRAAQLRELRERPLPRDAWVGASCHDEEELDLAARLGVDFATLSPVNATASHPVAEPLGWERFAQWVADARLPVYALGGIGPDDLDRALAAGAQGVAGIRAFLE